jgi:hypothetical protein
MPVFRRDARKEKDDLGAPWLAVHVSLSHDWKKCRQELGRIACISASHCCQAANGISPAVPWPPAADAVCLVKFLRNLGGVSLGIDFDVMMFG